MKKLVAIAFVIGALSCVAWSENPTHHYSIYIAPSFSDDESNAIMQAATTWQVATNNFITFNGTSSDQWGAQDQITVSPDSDIASLQIECGSCAIGCTYYHGTSSEIFLPVAGLDPDTFKQTAMHEIGHSIGMPHIGPGNIMCADHGCASYTVECGDVTKLAEVWNHEFNPTLLPVCKQ